jgi:hypothetical protein
VIVESGLGYHHVNVGSVVGDWLMIEQLMVGKGLCFEEEPKMLWVAEEARSM